MSICQVFTNLNELRLNNIIIMNIWIITFRFQLLFGSWNFGFLLCLDLQLLWWIGNDIIFLFYILLPRLRWSFHCLAFFDFTFGSTRLFKVHLDEFETKQLWIVDHSVCSYPRFIDNIIVNNLNQTVNLVHSLVSRCRLSINYPSSFWWGLVSQKLKVFYYITNSVAIIVRPSIERLSNDFNLLLLIGLLQALMKIVSLGLSKRSLVATLILEHSWHLWQSKFWFSFYQFGCFALIRSICRQPHLLLI